MGNTNKSGRDSDVPLLPGTRHWNRLLQTKLKYLRYLSAHANLATPFHKCPFGGSDRTDMSDSLP